MVEGVEQPALQIIVLGSGGGPLENNTTSFLVRSTASGWKKGSILAVDAGVHLAAIVKILDEHPSKWDENGDGKEGINTLIDGPFEGLVIPHASAKANAAFVTRTLIETCLITHPHLDHISGFIVNTAGLPGSRQKRLAGLPSTIEAFKNHIFNNVIWPNLSDENNGAGLVTYMRLVDGGSPALGDGEGKGYVEICEGLSVKPWSVSHGHCIENHSHRGSNAGLEPPTFRRESSPRLSPRRASRMGASPHPGSTSVSPTELLRSDFHERICVYNSSAYFIRDISTGKEVLIFGDVEPDSISLSPRNKLVWSEAAPKIVSGRLNGILIECSFDDSQSTDRLYGHMAPRFLIEEIKVLADEVETHRAAKNEYNGSKKRKLSNGNHSEERRSRRATRSSRAQSTISQSASIGIEVTRADSSSSSHNEEQHGDLNDKKLPIRNKYESPLAGVTIVIIHVKDKLSDDSETGDMVLKQLEEYEEEAQLGCKFIISKASEALYF